MGEISGSRVVLGVTGSIAAYKACDLAVMFVKAGAEVSVIMTESAQKFITPLSFESLTHRTVYTGMFEKHELEPQHISLAERADVILIAPASANTIAKCALGLADDLLSSVCMATRAPLAFAPAMNDGMYTHPATQQNIETLSKRGAIFIGPEEGRLASGKTGTGRMSRPEKIFEEVCKIISGKDNVC